MTRKAKAPRVTWETVDRSLGRPWTGTYHPRPNGRSFQRIVCPFGGETFDAYSWSIRGGGKVCPCGHMFGGMGFAYPPKATSTPERTDEP